MSAQIINFRPTGDQAWAQWAECAKPGAAPHFPADGDHAGIAAAKANCYACPVMVECLEGALASGEQWGIWGGLTAAERTTIRRNVARRARKSGEPRETMAELADAAARDALSPMDAAAQLDDASAGQLASSDAA
ncbi:transcriptional regulator WhiB-like [Streptomyces phage TP1604]|uniref:WhiB family transcription factor n=1 Tax=Streptomyces phage TP1604 TaxID=1636184 RepID=A0A0E3M319_9CAUD|nr:transcriptional regulator WhiB-like [Streptomyces phage TP1604]AKA61775.1 WhiB family transcription factor [Streptomyces phage TP1604]